MINKTTQLEDAIMKLDDLLNTEVYYGSNPNPIKITNYRIDEEKQQVAIDTSLGREHFKKSFESLPVFLTHLSYNHNAEKSVDLSKKNIQPEPVIPIGNCDKIEQMLMDALTKVNDDPAFVNQAKSIVDLSNQVINLNRLKLDIVKSSSKK